MNTPSAFGPEMWESPTPIQLVATYAGTNADAVRSALLAPQLGVKNVDVEANVFTILCKSREQATNVVRLLPNLSLELDMFHVDSGAH